MGAVSGKVTCLVIQIDLILVPIVASHDIEITVTIYVSQRHAPGVIGAGPEVAGATWPIKVPRSIAKVDHVLSIIAGDQVKIPISVHISQRNAPGIVRSRAKVLVVGEGWFASVGREGPESKREQHGHGQDR